MLLALFFIINFSKCIKINKNIKNIKKRTKIYLIKIKKLIVLKIKLIYMKIIYYTILLNLSPFSKIFSTLYFIKILNRNFLII